jgi:hypothetical protein
MNINGENSVNWENLPDIPMAGNTGNNDTDKLKGGTVSLTGSAFKIWTIDAGNQGIEKDKIEDILILIEYRI